MASQDRTLTVPAVWRRGQPSPAEFKALPTKAKKPKPPCSLEMGDTELAWASLVKAVDAGIAVMLSRTQDGGAISVTVYVGDNRYRNYAADPEELNAVWQAVQEVAKSR